MKENLEHFHPEESSERASHSHHHGIVEPSLFSSERGIRAVKWSFWALFATAVLQLIVVLISGSIALFADTIHNFADAATAIPLWLAFHFGRKKPTTHFTYGLGRLEDLAGLAVVIVILLSAVFIARESILRYIHPVIPTNLGLVAITALVGFLGNEVVAAFRIKTGKEIGSAALVADGHHARADGLSSLAVLFGAIGVWLGYPQADPIIGFVIALFIIRISWVSAKAVLPRLLDGVDPQVVLQVSRVASHVEGIEEVTEVRIRWIGHRLRAELNVAVDPKLSIEKGHELAGQVRHELLHHLSYLSDAIIHLDPLNASGEKHHEIEEHAHDGLPKHSH